MRVRRYIGVIVISTMIAACNPSPQASQPSQADIDNAVANAQEALAELEATKQELAAAKKQVQQPKKSYTQDRSAEPDPELAEPQSLCWQDYCPCEPGQDGQGAEATLCRNLKAGIPVDDKIMAAAAGMRDARQQLRDFERDNPGF